MHIVTTAPDTKTDGKCDWRINKNHASRKVNRVLVLKCMLRIKLQNLSGEGEGLFLRSF